MYCGMLMDMHVLFPLPYRNRSENKTFKEKKIEKITFKRDT